MRDVFVGYPALRVARPLMWFLAIKTVQPISKCKIKLIHYYVNRLNIVYL